jgi:hypothetical protein
MEPAPGDGSRQKERHERLFINADRPAPRQRWFLAIVLSEPAAERHPNHAEAAQYPNGQGGDLHSVQDWMVFE